MLIEKLPDLLEFLAANRRAHSRQSSLYRFTDEVAKHAIAEARPLFEKGKPVPIGELGGIRLPYYRMGAIDSLDLFGLDELIIFAFYHRSRGRYHKAADIGGNIGLHSIVMGKCGFEVETFEPDPTHMQKLRANIGLNEVKCVLHEEAVSDRVGEMEFVRVLGNTTGSHLAGAKDDPYGELQRFKVTVADIREIASRVDLMKIDAEGHEHVILSAIPAERWRHVDAIVEVGSPKNAAAVHAHFKAIGVNVFAQKLGWEKVVTVDQMPASYKEGGIFISAKPAMPW